MPSTAKNPNSWSSTSIRSSLHFAPPTVPDASPPDESSTARTRSLPITRIELLKRMNLTPAEHQPDEEIRNLRSLSEREPAKSGHAFPDNPRAGQEDLFAVYGDRGYRESSTAHLCRRQRELQRLTIVTTTCSSASFQEMNRKFLWLQIPSNHLVRRCQSSSSTSARSNRPGSSPPDEPSMTRTKEFTDDSPQMLKKMNLTPEEHTDLMARYETSTPL